MLPLLERVVFDTAEYLTHEGESGSLNPEKFYEEWGIDTQYEHVGGLKQPKVEASEREIYLLQRKTAAGGAGLGKTTGWIHRTGLKIVRSKCLLVCNTTR